MNESFRLGGALALGGLLATSGLTTSAFAQSNEIAAIPRVATTTQSRAASCNRACLEGFVDRYFAAVIADDPSAVPLAPNVRFTVSSIASASKSPMTTRSMFEGTYRAR